MTSKFNQAAMEDTEAVRSKVPLPVQKAKVTQVPSHPDEEGYHQVYVTLYYDGSQERALVLAGRKGDVALPDEGDDVMVLFGATDKPVVLGSFYTVRDRYGSENLDEVPDYEEGDRIIGNGSGGYVKIDDEGNVYLNSADDGDVYIDGTKQ